MWDNWIIDARMGHRGGFCFCPVELNGEEIKSVVVGMNFISNERPPHCKRLVGVVHDGGQEACEEFYAKYKNDLDRILGKKE